MRLRSTFPSAHADRGARAGTGTLLALVAMLITASSAPAVAQTSGRENFDGGLVVSGASGQRKVVGSVVAARGVFTGVGRIVERQNRPGDSEKVSRDDLVFGTGVLHIVNVNQHASLAVNRRSCTVRFKAKQITTIDGGTGRFAGATGRFVGTVTGSGVAGRKADGSCDQQHGPIVEVDTITATGTLTF